MKTKRCLVIGGGRIALRKVNELLEHGAEITVISPTFCIGLNELARNDRIHIIKRNYHVGDLEGAYLAVAATGSKLLNNRVAKEAHNNKVLLNVVDDPDLSDFIVPSVLHRGDITIAVSTGGKSPALAKKIRKRLETSFAAEYASLARLIGEVRTELHQRGKKIPVARWQNAIDLDIMIDLLRNGDEAKVRELLINDLKIQDW
ncbi:MAG: bifunctional precorrin-2 dehydrogenase/sirohydrochlorin ferrochelatase [Dehalococcoidia bacterium]|nr:bifunctional precorrin-2 dehydrogenase/sirohydrochlorin ferrochelatase [Dehalococcoidia bacterium]